MRGLALLAALLAFPVWAAEPTASMNSSAMGAQLSKLLLGLLLVIGLIFLLAWLLRRVQQLNPRGTQVIKLISSQALGPRERLVLVSTHDPELIRQADQVVRLMPSGGAEAFPYAI